MSKTLDTIKSYLGKLSHRNLGRFIVEVSLLTFGIKIITALILAGLSLLPGLEILTVPLAHEDLFYNSESGIVTFPLLIITLVVLVIPLVETLLTQLLPIEILNTVTGKPRFAITVSAILFASLHGFPDMLIVLPTGFILAWSYYIQRQHSVWNGLLITSVLHAIQNGIALPLSYLDIFLTKDINEFWISLL